jgi:hypothetical protein
MLSRYPNLIIVETVEFARTGLQPTSGKHLVEKSELRL